MLRCVGVVRAVQQVSRNAGALKQNHSKLSYSIRNFSHINPNVASSLLLTHRSGISANQVRFESSGATEFVLDNIPGPKTVLESFPHSNPLLENIPQTSPLLDNIPEPPVIPDLVTKVTEAIVSGAEPAFSTLGLGGWTPVGIVQNCMEFLHIGCDLPWWTCVMIGTVFVRTIIFPLVIVSQRNSAKMSNNMPQIQHLQAKMTEARQSGNAIDAARFSQEMVTYMKEKELNPLKNLVVPLAQAPLFISFFIGLRQMANAPVESLRDGGLFWFVDLTVPDQFFLLPIITSFTMLATIEVGTDGARLASANLQTMKYVLRALPFVILPFTINFPGIILAYWTCSNFISLAQVGFLKVPKVREYFKIDKLIVHKPSELAKKKGFREGIKDSWTNMKITRELEERKRIDEIIFQRAAKGAVQKTYKYDPTKPRNAPTPMHAKKV